METEQRPSRQLAMIVAIAKNGVIGQYRYKGVTLLDRGPVPDFWRAPTNNDRGAWKDLGDRVRTDRSLDIAVWREAGQRWDMKQVTIEIDCCDCGRCTRINTDDQVLGFC